MLPTQGANMMRTLAHNRALVYRKIRELGRVSRTELAAATGLTQAAMTNIVRDLLERGLVQEGGTTGMLRGRPSIQLSVNANAYCVLGLQISRAVLRTGVFNLGGELLALKEAPVADFRQAAVVLSEARRLLEAVLAESGVERRKISGLGIATPGPVDHEQGRLNLVADGDEWVDQPVAGYFAEAMGLPVMLDTNENASATAEHWFGAARGEGSFAYVNTGAGVGASLMLAGRILRGATLSAGQLGHVSVNPRGRRCACGNHGCVEWEVSVQQLVRGAAEAARRPGAEALRDLLASRADPTDGFFAAVAAGESVACGLVQRAGALLGMALVNLINLFNPPLIVLGGVMLRAGPLWVDAVQQSAFARLPERVSAGTRILAGSLGQEAVMVGAATLAIEQLFTFPDVAPGGRQGE